MLLSIDEFVAASTKECFADLRNCLSDLKNMVYNLILETQEAVTIKDSETKGMDQEENVFGIDNDELDKRTAKKQQNKETGTNPKLEQMEEMGMSDKRAGMDFENEYINDHIENKEYYKGRIKGGRAEMDFQKEHINDCIENKKHYNGKIKGRKGIRLRHGHLIDDTKGKEGRRRGGDVIQFSVLEIKRGKKKKRKKERKKGNVRTGWKFKNK